MQSVPLLGVLEPLPRLGRAKGNALVLAELSAKRVAMSIRFKARAILGQFDGDAG
jgi:hypothetical protein